MEVRIAATDEEIAACFPVMVQLRPHLRPEQFVERIRKQEEEGYRLAFIASRGAVRAVAGFRFQTNLAWGRFLYVDDLVTEGGDRSKGFGKALLGWCVKRAEDGGCHALHLDSGVQRHEAHRFYFREGMRIMGYHFGTDL